MTDMWTETRSWRPNFRTVGQAPLMYSRCFRHYSGHNSGMGEPPIPTNEPHRWFIGRSEIIFGKDGPPWLRAEFICTVCQERVFEERLSREGDEARDYKPETVLDWPI